MRKILGVVILILFFFTITGSPVAEAPVLKFPAKPQAKPVVKSTPTPRSTRLASREAAPERYVMRVTAYTACDRGMDGRGITSSGTQAKPWHTVAAPPEIPFGTRLYIPYFADKPNRGWFVVEDRGGAITGNCLDVFFASRQDAIQFGVKYLDVYLSTTPD